MRRGRSRPQDRPYVVRALAIVYAIGVPLAFTWLVLPHRDTEANEVALLVLFTAATLLGIAFLSGQLGRAVSFPLGLTVGASNVMVALSVYFSGAPDSALALFYLWLTPVAYGFLTPPHAAFHTVLAGASYAVVLIVLGDNGGYPAEESVGRWVVTIGSIVVLGALLRRAMEAMRESDARFRLGFEAAPVGMALVDTDWRWLDVNDALCRFLGRERDDLVGRSMDDVTHPDDVEASRAAFAAAVEGRTPSLEKRCLRPDGAEVWAGVTSSAVRGPTGEVTYYLCQVEDVTQKRRIDQVRRGQERLRARRVRELELMAELSRKALEGGSVDEVLDIAGHGVAEVLDAEIVGLVQPDGDHMRLREGSHRPAGIPLISVPMQRSFAAYCMRIGEPVITDDLPGETRFEPPPELLSAGIQSAMVVPVMIGGRTYGAYAAAILARHRFTQEDVNFLQSVGNLIAVALRHAESLESLEELAEQRGRLLAETLDAEETTRRAISEMLHERALQELLAARQDVEEAVRHPDREGSLERAGAGIERAVSELRSAVFELHPLALTHGGLQTALDNIATRHSRRAGFEVRVEVENGVEGANDQLILGLARELLANAAKHSDARVVEVNLRRRGEMLELRVADDGRGMSLQRPQEALGQGHIGLASSMERVEAAGGRLVISSDPERGTSVTASLPDPAG